MPSSSILFFASGSFKNLRVYRSDLPSLRRYSRGSKDVSVVFAASAARTLVEIFVVVVVVLLLLPLVAAIIFIVIVSPRIIIIEVLRPPLLLREVDRAEDAGTLLLDDNIIPNAKAVLIYFVVVVPKTKRENRERVTASKSYEGLDYLFFFKEQKRSLLSSMTP